MSQLCTSLSLLKVSQKRGVTLYYTGLVWPVRGGGGTSYRALQSSLTCSPIKSYNTLHLLETCLFPGRQSMTNFPSREKRFVSYVSTYYQRNYK